MQTKVKLLILASSIILSTNLYAQTNKDSTDLKIYVEQAIKNSNSIFYYPKLLEKIRTQPAELNIEDCFYLYYGQIFQKEHKAISFVANPERLEFDKAVMKGNCSKVLELGNIILERTPFDLTVLLNVCTCIRKKGIPDPKYFDQRFKNTLSAILLTGDGKSKKTAIRIVNVEDDYVLKGVLGFLGGEEKLGFETNHSYSIWEKGNQKLYFEDVMTIGN